MTILRMSAETMVDLLSNRKAVFKINKIFRWTLDYNTNFAGK